MDKEKLIFTEEELKEITERLKTAQIGDLSPFASIQFIHKLGDLLEFSYKRAEENKTE